MLRSVQTTLKKTKNLHPNSILHSSNSSVTVPNQTDTNQIVELYPGHNRTINWLQENGFEKYTTHFTEHEITVECLPELQRQDLKDMGIWKVGVILNILRAAKKQDKKKRGTQ